jgi:hypothetical protein
MLGIVTVSLKVYEIEQLLKQNIYSKKKNA